MKIPNRKLTPRELECLAWAAQGKTYADISSMLGIPFGTVKTNLDAARWKLGGVNLTHTVALAILQGHLFMTEQTLLARQQAAELEWTQRHFVGEIGVIR